MLKFEEIINLCVTCIALMALTVFVVQKIAPLEKPTNTGLLEEVP